MITMADRYQERTFPADDYDRGTQRAETDPLAELARLIGQADPFDTAPRQQPAPHPLQSRANARPQAYQPPADDEDVDLPAGPPPWMQRARHEAAPQPQHQDQYQEHYQEDEEPALQPAAVHPLRGYVTPQPVPLPDYREELPLQLPTAQEVDLSRYDDALYGQIEAGAQDFQREAAYPDDPYAYDNSAYEDDEPAPRRRSSGLMTVASVLALAVLGTGAAFAYRTYVGSPRSGEPPIIKADNSPTKIVPAQPDAPKSPDRVASADGTEKLISREETPVDVNAKSGPPRVVFPPLNQNANPPPVASVAPSAPMTSNGTLPNNEPRRISTLSIKGGGNDAGTQAAAPPPPPKPAPVAVRSNPAAANASINAPMSLAPGAPQAEPAPAPTRLASTNPTGSVSAGGYLVQVSSQRNEADAQSSYRTLQGKYPNVLGAQSLVVKRVDLGEKGVYYRAFAGPFASADQASQVCSSLKAAGGPQCLVQRN